MKCIHCARELPADAVFCCYCGKKLFDNPVACIERDVIDNGTELSVKKNKLPKRQRGNGTGTAIKRGRTWEARVVVDWKLCDDGHTTPIRRSKGGFRTKTEALAYCAELKKHANGEERQAPTLRHYWATYAENELAKLSRDKQSAYRIAWRKMEELHDRRVTTITVADLRRIVSEKCPTYYPARDCKVLLNHLFGLAGAEGWVSKDLPTYIISQIARSASVRCSHLKSRKLYGQVMKVAIWTPLFLF